LIVDDSAFVRKALLRIFEAEPSIMVAGTAKNGKEAIEKILSLRPDVVTLDIMMPEMDGIESLGVIMEKCPVPVLILSQFTHEGAELTLRALQLGAMDFVDKSTRGLMDFIGLASEIVSKVKAIAKSRPQRLTDDPGVISGYRSHGAVDVVAIGASTGGPPALHVILRRFPREVSFGILIVQHMPRGFTATLARRLDTVCSLEVKEAEEGDGIRPGLALVAPSGLHMKIKKGGVTLEEEPSKLIHRPSVDVLFHSVAEAYGSRSMGVILTGMGSDGAEGMKHIKEKGGITLAQDETSSVIFGMPRVAIETGAADKVVPLADMAEEILQTA
jgi:two-component system chemotaxis response regulator CheB